MRRGALAGRASSARSNELGLVDEPRMFRYPVVVGGGTLFLPPVTEDNAPSCGTFFVPNRANQQWCGEPCGTRARVARHAARHRPAR